MQKSIISLSDGALVLLLLIKKNRKRYAFAVLEMDSSTLLKKRSNSSVDIGFGSNVTLYIFFSHQVRGASQSVNSWKAYESTKFHVGTLKK